MTEKSPLVLKNIVNHLLPNQPNTISLYHIDIYLDIKREGLGIPLNSLTLSQFYAWYVHAWS
jgi:hypothetical protein